MPRRRSPEKRKVLPDPKYKDIVLAKFMNNLMKDGKKSVAEKIVYGAFDQITKNSKDDPLEVFMKALEEVSPVVEVKSRKLKRCKLIWNDTNQHEIMWIDKKINISLYFSSFIVL